MTGNNQNKPLQHDLSVVLCGEAGQGIQTIEHVLTGILKRTGYHTFTTKEYMSRVRGGENSTEIRIASERVATYVDRIDVFFPLSKDAVTHLANRLSEDTLILGEKASFDSSINMIDIPFSAIAEEVGGKIYQNSIAVGVVLGMLQVDAAFYKEYYAKYFASKPADVIEKNILACSRGYERGARLLETNAFQHDLKTNPDVYNELLMNSAEAVALGAIAGGCNFVSSYPMSPATAVLVNLAGYSHEFEIAVEQAEDEISAINMALGAWYAGARALVSTSGGGFALMAEGISLCGMIETPVVVHLAQRPGPATGLPTRTEQGDLELALYAGHGEFPRILLAPGSIEQAFELTHRAFDLADKFQVPVFILTDQYLMDSYYNIPALDLTALQNANHIVETDADYARYKLTENGLSPRGVPGFGKGLVRVDSDEHTEQGCITEDLNLRVQMSDKRLKKMDAILGEFISPELVGCDDYETLVVCWGSNYHPVKEALTKLDNKKVAMLHFSQLFPLHPDVTVRLEKAKKLILVENNATAQFGKVILLQTGVSVQNKILKYNGMPFSVEELVVEIGRIASEG